MKVDDTIFTSCYIITPDIYRDYRGEYTEIYNEEQFSNELNKFKFVQDDISLSYKNVLRGFHGDDRTWKLISCLYGRFQFVVIDYRPDSPTFKKSMSMVLDDKLRQQVLVPPEFGNAHLCLSDTCLFHYKQTSYYTGAENQFTISWKQFNGWAIDNPILSERDNI